MNLFDFRIQMILDPCNIHYIGIVSWECGKLHISILKQSGTFVITAAVSPFSGGKDPPRMSDQAE